MDALWLAFWILLILIAAGCTWLLTHKRDGS